MEDSSYEKVKHKKQRRNIMYMLFGQYVYISICVIYVLSYLSSYSIVNAGVFSHLRNFLLF